MYISRQFGRWGVLLLSALIAGCSEAQVKLADLSPADTLIAFSGATSRVGFGQPPYGDAWIYNHRSRSFHRLTDTRVNITDVELYQERAGGEIGAFVAAALEEDERTYQLGAPTKLQRLPLKEPASLVDRDDYENTLVHALSVCKDGSAGAYVEQRKDHPLFGIYTFKTQPFEKRMVGSIGFYGDLTTIDCNTIAVTMGTGDSLNSFVLFKNGKQSGRVVLDRDYPVFDMSASRNLLYILAGDENEGDYVVYTFDPQTETLEERCTFEREELVADIAAFGDVVFLASSVNEGSEYIMTLRLSDCTSEEVLFEGMKIRNISALNPVGVDD